MHIFILLDITYSKNTAGERASAFFALSVWVSGHCGDVETRPRLELFSTVNKTITVKRFGTQTQMSNKMPFSWVKLGNHKGSNNLYLQRVASYTREKVSLAAASLCLWCGKKKAYLAVRFFSSVVSTNV